MPLRVSAISFLNPAPLLYNFEHEPTASELRSRYELHYTSPAQCAAELGSGAADLGLIPIAELTPQLRIVPGCAIASLGEVRSILLLVRNPVRLSTSEALRSIHTLVADTSSRSSVAYTRILLKRFYGNDPVLLRQPADPLLMLAEADAALLIGDPALYAREYHAAFDTAFSEPLLWLDLAQLWREHTGLPWVAAVWAARPEALGLEVSAAQLVADLTASRDAGLAHIEELVREWSGRVPLPAEVIRTYLTDNIYYRLDAGCLEAMRYFRKLGSELGILPALETLPMLGEDESSRSRFRREQRVSAR